MKRFLGSPRFAASARSGAKVLALLVGTAAAVVFSGNAQAAAVFSNGNVDMYLKGNTFPNNLNEEKIFLNAGTGTTVTGQVGSQNGTPTVQFTSSTSLDAANGFATIKGENNAIYHDLTFSIPGYRFGDLIFDVELNDPQQSVSLEVTAFDGATELGSYSGFVSQDDWVNGLNDILVLATGGNLMTAVVLESPTGFISVGGTPADGIDQTKHFQVSDVTPVPLPGAVWLFGSGVLGLLGIGYSRRRQAAA